MLEPRFPANEEERAKALELAGLLYSPAEDRFDRITRIAIKTFGVQTALVSLVASNVQWFKAKSGLDACETPRAISFCGHAILDDDILLIPDALEDPRFRDNPLVTGAPFIRFYAGKPIATEGGLKLGTLCLIDPKPRTLSEGEKDHLRDLAGWVENEIRMPQLSLAQQDLILELTAAKRQALLDSLTSIWNRRGIMEILQRESSRTHREGKSFAVIMVDIDHFKKINDGFGHAAGDKVLVEVSQVLRSSVRAYDAVGRLGGEEFLVVLTDCDLGDALAIGEKMRLRISNREIAFESKILKATVSLGIAVHPKDKAADIDALIAEADQLLYAAKNQGRNRCIGQNV